MTFRKIGSSGSGIVSFGPSFLLTSVRLSWTGIGLRPDQATIKASPLNPNDDDFSFSYIFGVTNADIYAYLDVLVKLYSS